MNIVHAAIIEQHVTVVESLSKTKKYFFFFFFLVLGNSNF